MLRLQVFVSGMALAGFTLAGGTVASAQEPAKPVLTLDGDAAVITLLIKPDKTAEFESVIAKLRESLSKSDKPERKQQLAGWKIFKSAQAANGQAVYIFFIDPVVKDQEYDLTRIIAEVFPVEVQEVFQKYKDSFAGRAIASLSKVP
ncbi:MAG: hypothetical protein A3J29_11900 [Acidobacteria bacterium RIFCSPLOWO2_12_FULL_67_14b]|nr:MAG: hypothetical protein A3J29_11900 [Acidobacteria bacterium RIFCSPLOWO2_12_FULL_67_14b]